MSKNKLKYSDTKLIKTKKNRGFRPLFFILLIIASICMVLFLSGSLGNVIKVNSFSFLFNKSSVVKVSSHSYYAVTMGSYQTLEEAQNVAGGTSILGAGSYVWHNNGNFYVIGNVYEKKDDADKVLLNIKDSNYATELVEIKFKGFKFNHENYTKEQRQAIKDTIKYIDEIYKKCYSYTIQFDLREIMAIVVSSELNTLKGEVKVLSSKLDAINSVTVTSQALLLKNSYIKLEEELEGGVLKVIDGSSASRDLKYLTIAISIIKYNLYNNISGLT